jgi:hypothetical protein
LRKGDNIFKNSNYCRESGKRHKDIKGKYPDFSGGHGVKNIGESDKNKTGAAAGIHAKSETGRKDDQSGHERDKRIQNGNIQSFSP